MSATGGETGARPEEPSGSQSWQVGPVTTHALTCIEVDGAQGPPAMVAEWHNAVSAQEDFILLWAGTAQRPEGEEGTRLSWSYFVVSRAEADADKDDDTTPDDGIPYGADLALKIESLLAPLSHESRVRILQALYRGSMNSSGLSDAAGLNGGNLYHHLRGLIHAGYVTEVDDGYALSGLGRQMLITVACIADRVIEDRGKEGLVVGGL